ncbi:MAG: hypothetical protein ICV79_27935 [Flavisolibacter sp.]|nr:hypothetical protein [Flavisolibacter sp.]
MKQLTITHYSLTTEGLQLSYTFDGQHTNLSLDACSFCELLKEAGAIEDFTTDGNSEPVILYSDSNEPVGYGYELWCDFIKSFPFNSRVAELLIEHRESTQTYRRTVATIDYLLSPLTKATA